MSLTDLTGAHRLPSATRILAAISFILVYSVDPSYYFISSLNGYPKLPIGLLGGAVAASLCAPLLLKSSRANWLLVGFSVFIGFMLAAAWHSGQFDLGWLFLSFWYVSLFGLGVSLVVFRADALPWFRWLVSGLALFGSAIIIASLARGFDNSEAQLNYLRVSNGLVLTGIFALYATRSLVLRAALFAIVALSLAMLTSRFYFYIWIAVPSLFLLVRGLDDRASVIKRLQMGFLSGTALIISVATAYLWTAPVLAKIVNPRIASIAPDADTSINARIEGFRAGIGQIIQSPLWGAYNRHLDTEFGYIHNGLSYWQQFGFVPFAIVFLAVTILSLKAIAQGIPPGTYQPAIVCAFVVFVGFVLARAYTATELWLGLGMMAAAIGWRPAPPTEPSKPREIHRILVVTNSYPSEGSKEKTFIHHEIEDFVRSGLEVTIAPIRLPLQIDVTLPSQARVDLRLAREFGTTGLAKSIVEMALDDWVYRELFARPKLLFNRRFWKEAMRLQAARRYGYAISGAYDAYYTLWFTADTVGLARAGCRPLLTRAHGYDLYEEVEANKSYIPFRRRAAVLVDKLVVLSEQARLYAGRFGFDAKRIAVIPLGVPAQRDDERASGADIVVASCAYPSPGKRLNGMLKVLIRLAERNPERKVTWHHFGADMEDLRNDEIMPANLSVMAYGKIPNDRITAFYSQQSVSFFFNFSVSEGQPVSVMEAMSFGIPVVAPDVGGLKELVSGGGLLVSVSATEDEVCDTIDMLLERNADQSLSRAAMARQQDAYDSARNAARMVEQLRNVVDKFSQRPLS